LTCLAHPYFHIKELLVATDD